MKEHRQKLPTAGPKRQALREKGQFWTPNWVAEAMVGYVLGTDSDHILDPAVGPGAFFRAAKTTASEMGKPIALIGTEIDPAALQQARANELTASDLSYVEITDFVLHPPKGLFKAIVANPPYIRHHRLSNGVKTELKKCSTALMGKPLDGRAVLHVCFLIRALQLLDTNGRLAFIMPADTCEGVFASTLWDWITNYYRLEAVVTFTPEASPFPNVDTNPIILMIRNANPTEHFLSARCTQWQPQGFKEWVNSRSRITPSDGISVWERWLSEGLSTGLSRAPAESRLIDLTLGHFAKVMRGIATGANEFFSSTTDRQPAWKFPTSFSFVRLDARVIFKATR